MWLPSSRWIRLLCPILKGMGIGYCLLPPYLSDILTSKDSIWKLLLRMHSGAGGAWQWYFASFTSLALLGWPNKACTFCANLLQLGTPGTANNSLHQSGVLIVSAFHVTHLQNSPNGSSGGGPSSSKLSTDPLRKEVTPGSNSGSSPRSEIQGWFPLAGLWTVSRKVIGGRAVSEVHLAMPPLVLCGSMHLAVSTL